MLPSSVKPVEVITIAESIPMYHPPLPLEVQLVDVDWSVLTPELMQEYLLALEEGSAPRSAYYSLTTKEYENLSMNMAELKRYLKDSLHIIEYYREYDNEEESEDN
jgi:hypothetical protein|tara:strand:+ start:1982 stop:2299 length:318 start_codon:yes stop_codon:yes gene_type:complete